MSTFDGPARQEDDHSSSGVDPVQRGAPRFGIVKALLVLAALLAVAAAILVPAIGSAREAARRATCQCRLKQLGLALQNYMSAFGTFPPAYVADDNGRRMHSWRVLLLPYLKATELTDAYDLSEPWDGPNNRKLIDRMPDIYRCPSDDHASPGSTNFVAVVGPETLWPGSTGRKPDEITDGLSNTIAVVEVTGLDIPWIQPRDLEFANVPLTVDPQSADGIRSNHGPAATNVLLADGSVRFFENVDPTILRALLTAAGNESASPP
jgi:type II secretory pathway pseudopilin PulG